MKSFLIFIVMFHSLLAYNYSLEPKNIGSAAKCFFGLPEVMDEHNNGNMSNSCFVDMGSSYLVIDSGPTYQYAREAYSKIQKQKKLPVSYVIDTHTHDDHWLGNGFYKTQGATIVGSIAFKELAILDITRMQRRISTEAYKGTKQIIPTIFVDGETTLYFGSKKVIITSVNHKAHTDSDLLIYIPSKHILFAGDIIFNERLPSLRDGNINGWIKILKKIKKMDLDYIVGGHGKLYTKDAVNFTYEYLTTLKQEVLKHIEDSDEIGETVNTVIMKKYKDIPFYNSIHKQNIETVYRTLEWEDE